MSDKHEPWHRKDDYDIVRCSGCGFVFVEPPPSAEFLKNYYTERETKEQQFQPVGGIGRRLKYKLFAWWIKRYFPKNKAIRTLEVGCGQGDLLRAVQHDPRFVARGLDYAREPLNYARRLGLRVDQSDIQSMGFADSSFDLVVGIHVLEHVLDPRATIAEIYRVLCKGGMLFAVCPCMSHIKARLAGRNWKYVLPPVHLWYFTPVTLARLLESCGFTVVTASSLYHRAHVRILARK